MTTDAGASGAGPPLAPPKTFTFLFTDIEGSTRLWEEHPEAMRVALARHDALLRGAIGANDGTVFKTIGDAFCAVFPAAGDAVRAALDAQKSLHRDAPWEGAAAAARPRVRMALHAGEAEARDGDYFGPPLNRVARLLQIAHGGQTLLSEVAAALARGAAAGLPDGADLLDLGEHRLRDLQHPERVFQLLHPELPADFPPPRSLSALPNNLPRQVSRFIGRKAEMGTIQDLLRRSRLVTLTGTGGGGKTRLALQAAAERLEDYRAGGVWLVELGSLPSSGSPWQALATALAVPETPGRSLEETLTTRLRGGGAALLVLDNCEHLLDSSARLAEALLRACPDLNILATSRQPLGIAGEISMPVPPLSIPADPARLPSPARLAEYEALRLFFDRATAVSPGFEITAENAPAAARICHRLDGIPLAIELTAAWVRVLPLAQIEARLGDRFRFLTRGHRTAVPRQQTLRATIDWSYDLLSPEEQTLLRRLSVFAGGWTLEAAEAVCAAGDLPADDILDLLFRLVEKSLVLADPREGGEGRFRFLDTIRAYAQTRLRDSGEATDLRARHAAFFLGVAENAAAGQQGPEQEHGFDLLEREHDNCRAALTDEQTGAEARLRLAGALHWFWMVRGHLSEGRGHIEAALAAAVAVDPPVPDPIRAKAWNGAGILAMAAGDLVGARAALAESLRLYRPLGDAEAIAKTLNNLAIVESKQESFAAARRLYEEAHDIYQSLGHEARAAQVLGNLGAIAMQQGDYEAARAYLRECLPRHERRGDKFSLANALENLGMTALHQGDPEEALRLLRNSLRIRQEIGDKSLLALTLSNIAAARQERGDPVGSVRLFAAAGAVAAVLEIVPSESECSDLEKRLDVLRGLLGADAFSAAWDAGRAWTLEQAVADALG